MHQSVDRRKVLITVSLRAQEKISGKVLRRLLLTKQGTWTDQVRHYIYVMYFHFINFPPHYDQPGETCWVRCPEVTFSGRFGPLCSWWHYHQICGNRHSLLDCRVTLAEVLVLCLTASLENGVRMIPKCKCFVLKSLCWSRL